MLDKLAGLWYNGISGRINRGRPTELYHKNAILSIGKIHKKNEPNFGSFYNSYSDKAEVQKNTTETEKYNQSHKPLPQSFMSHGITSKS